VPVLNPQDRSSLDLALTLKETVAGTHVTVIHLGPLSEEGIIREALALGCDEGLRIWDEGLHEVQVQAKALVFERLARILGFDLILTGAKSEDIGSGQLGLLVASHLQIPCVTPVTLLEIKEKERSVVAVKRLAQGFLERIEAPLPLLIAMEAQAKPIRYASLPACLEALEKDVPCLDLAEIGMSRQSIEQVNAHLAMGPLKFPGSRLKFVTPPDSTLPAFDRIRQLIEGTVKRRAGKVVRGTEDYVVEELFDTLLREGWLNHLRQRESDGE
jgi:electron transfer flavoprotein beta subunit